VLTVEILPEVFARFYARRLPLLPEFTDSFAAANASKRVGITSVAAMATTIPPTTHLGWLGISKSVPGTPSVELRIIADKTARTKGHAMQMILLVRLEREGKTVENQ
jgi:hypothetical protein